VLVEANADVRQADDGGETPVLYASEHGHTEVVKLLLAKGALADFATHTLGMTPLYAASSCGRTAVVKVLLAAGASPAKARTDGDPRPTALLSASGGGHWDAVRLLIAAGADPTEASSDGYTPLLDAALHGDFSVVKKIAAAAERCILDRILDATADVEKAPAENGSSASNG